MVFVTVLIIYIYIQIAMNKLQFFALIDDRDENGVTLQTVSYVPKQLCWSNSLVGLFELFGSQLIRHFEFCHFVASIRSFFLTQGSGSLTNSAKLIPSLIDRIITLIKELESVVMQNELFILKVLNAQ